LPGALGVAENGRGAGHEMTPSGAPLPSPQEPLLRELAAIVASSGDAILSKRLDGTIRSWNAAAERMYGYTAEEAIGQPIMIITPDDRAAEVADILARIRLGEKVDHHETVRRRKDGTLVWWRHP
jgi:PAS domain S-box-containing protein